MVNSGVRELNCQTAEEMLPQHLKLLGNTVLAILESTQQLVAIIAVPIRVNGELSAVISFDICTERAHTTNWPQEKLDVASELCKMLETELRKRTG